jgi:hypothetical protein
VTAPSSPVFTLPDAVTVPLAVTGGQAPAHAPEHADFPPLSFTHKYRARPEPSVRTGPAELCLVVIIVADEDEDAPPALAPVLLLLAHPAATGTTSSAAAIHIFFMQVATARRPIRLATIM